jgi:A/G-specific adenine glycosylase
MDHGATICRPKAPLCDRCPVSGWCEALKTGAPDRYPLKRAKADRPRRYGVAYLLTRGDEVALVRRPPKGLLGGMLALPTSEWRGSVLSEEETLAAAPVQAHWKDAGEIEHVFTHFALKLRVLKAEGSAVDVIWTRDLSALPSVFLKAARRGL